ncbi:GATA-type domain-containing protein [Mycena indigotica]|uniref:GATA-type domain-containing protein n=1 Tax=Mycena indigotica TaxID=2126181 RepID=A0A8H6VRJ2_9AGAR|nr:GATA-type domain-containing protein [Mycena indigotica]KAF7291407.1 GATA-type domain-containing protein [Mycena indigotica]
MAESANRSPLRETPATDRDPSVDPAAYSNFARAKEENLKGGEEGGEKGPKPGMVKALSLPSIATLVGPATSPAPAPAPAPGTDTPPPVTAPPQFVHDPRFPYPVFIYAHPPPPNGAYPTYDERGVPIPHPYAYMPYPPIAPGQAPAGGAVGGGPVQSGPVVTTDDVAAKLGPLVRRRCFNCCTTDTSTWRRSTLSPGKVLCNKCGLFERTHSRPRPEQFPHKRVFRPVDPSAAPHAQVQAGGYPTAPAAGYTVPAHAPLPVAGPALPNGRNVEAAHDALDRDAEGEYENPTVGVQQVKGEA